MYPASDDLSRPEAAAAFNAFTPNRLNASGIEKGTRAYASWLGWWKSTINTDDYFKYMSTQVRTDVWLRRSDSILCTYSFDTH